ncbi:MAG: hypothetical protein B6245_22345 [Desulfobacteraceae bacterium 4572_88]|nr:MAG: hypothetical protein B6245_22345 [Desulfobacteraceae bacterium 4572_88]
MVKKVSWVTLIAFGLMGILAGTAFASAENEYPNGIEGIKAASVPPPGFYYRMYNVFYTADTLTDSDGDELDVDFDLNLFVNAHRFIWTSKQKILGGYYGADLIVPIFNIDFELGAFGLDDENTGMGDICLEPLILSWHGARYDAAVAAGFYAPTGESHADNPALSPGKDMWTGMFTLGGTLYFDVAKTWSASVLARYEVHGVKKYSRFAPGDDFHFEWGLGKTVAKVLDIGVTGYCQWQVTDDSGPGSTGDKDSVYAVGPEASIFIPSAMFFMSLRSQWEFGAEDRSEGIFTTLTLTKIF